MGSERKETPLSSLQFRHYKATRNCREQRSLSIYVFKSAILATAAVIVGCGYDPSPASEKHQAISSQRQVFHPELDSDARALARTATGEFAIAMSTSTATAAMTDNQGIFKWKYKDPERGGSGSSRESAFNGVLPLQNGNVLFCGNKSSAYRKQKALIQIFDAQGTKLEERMMTPHSDDQYPGADFLRCIAWDNGIALAGTALKPTVGAFGWIVKLDKLGKVEWEVLDDSLAPSQAVTTPKGSLVIAGYNGFGMRIAVISSEGKVLATRTLSGSAGVLLNSTSPAKKKITLLLYGGEKTMIYSLDEQLKDIAEARPINSDIDITHGCGFVRGDGSLALFGRLGGAERGLVAPSGKEIGRAGFGDPQSFSIIDAVPIGEHQFVSLRRTDGPDPKGIGLMLAWDSFE